MRHLVQATLTIVALAASAAGQAIQLVSQDPSGTQGNGSSLWPSASGSGRYVAFECAATNFDPSDTNGYMDIYVHDRETGLNVRASVDSAGAQANEHSNFASISDAGGRVAFVSKATNLVAGDTNTAMDVFVRDLQAGTTRRVSVDSAGVQGGDYSYSAEISGDGRWVAFISLANNLDSIDTNLGADAFVHHLDTQQTKCVSVDSNGLQGVGNASVISISTDGQRVAFSSNASLAPNDSNGFEDVFLRDFQSGTTVRVSSEPGGLAANGASGDPAISGDGRFVAFTSSASNLVANDSNGESDIFVRNLQTGAISRVSLDISGGDANRHSYSPVISADGRYVAFVSWATDLVPGLSGDWQELFLRDRANDQTLLVNHWPWGAQAGWWTLMPSISADGSVVAYATPAGCVPGDLNGILDVFLLDNDCGVSTVFCQSKPNSLGCMPSISLSGTPSASAGSGAVLTTSQVLGQQTGVYFHSQTAKAPSTFHGGFLCASAPLVRHAVTNSAGSQGSCSGVFTEDLNTYIASGADPALAAGAAICLQHWSRDPAAPFGDSLSNAVIASICP